MDRCPGGKRALSGDIPCFNMQHCEQVCCEVPPTPAPTPWPTPAPTPWPKPAPTPWPTPAPTPWPTPAPTPWPTPAPTVPPPDNCWHQYFKKRDGMPRCPGGKRALSGNIPCFNMHHCEQVCCEVPPTPAPTPWPTPAPIPAPTPAPTP